MTNNNSEKVIIDFDGKRAELPIITGTRNEKAIDIATLRNATGLITLDVGFKNTGSTLSAITFLDGENGILNYRGYAIEDLAEHCTFTEVAYLLLYDKLPTEEELKNFNHDLSRHTLVHEAIKNFFDGFPSDAHPMGQLSCLISSLYAYYPDSLKQNPSDEEVDVNIRKLLAKMPTIVSMIYKKQMGHPVIYPQNSMDYVTNLINMTFGQRTEEIEIDPIVTDAMEKLLILHADHEQNCSTSTVRIVGSAETNLYSSVSAGIAALWGPLHGGANQEVIQMLETINRDGSGISKWIEKAKDKNDPFKLMGFGHRVYKNFDPRAKIIKKACHDILNKLGVHDPALELAMQIEEIALKDSYFVDRKLYPNVDFYSGIIYKALGFPTEMFTVLFALGRLPGWMAQWKEGRKQKNPIGRPRQLYTGENEKKFVPLGKRS